MKDIISPKTILITGAGGFVGANLVRALLEHGANVHIIWKKTSIKWRLQNIKGTITYHDIDMLDLDLLTRTVHSINPNGIFHLAAHGAYSTQNDVQKMIQVNVQSTYNLLAASKDIPYDTFINTGSSSEYGFKDTPMKETDCITPNSFYAATKASGTHICAVFANQFNKPIVTFRLFSVYGQYEEPSRFIPTIMKAVHTGQPINLTLGSQRRDFVFINDIVNAYILALNKGMVLSGKICNIGTGKEYSNDEVVDALFKVTQTTVPINKGAFQQRQWDANHWVGDVSLAKELLGWKSEVSLEEGLLKTYQWYIDNYSLYEN